MIVLLTSAALVTPRNDALVVVCCVLAAVGIMAVLRAFRTLPQPPEYAYFDPNPASGRLRPGSVRWYEPNDFDACVELYRLNEPGRFPDGHLPEFERSLANDGTSYLVIEEGSRIVAVGGILSPQVRLFSFCYGLVLPELHGQGFGAALLLARIALLPEPDEGHCNVVTLLAVPSSQSYYARYGLKIHGTDEGLSLPLTAMHAFVTREIHLQCVAALAQAGVHLPPARPIETVLPAPVAELF